jgi:catalase
VRTEAGDTLAVEVTLEAMPSVLFDALAVPGGKQAATTLGNIGHALEFIKEQYRHCKPILGLREGADLIENAGVPSVLFSGSPDPGVLVFRQGAPRGVTQKFADAIARHRHYERETDPPQV